MTRPWHPGHKAWRMVLTKVRRSKAIALRNNWSLQSFTRHFISDGYRRAHRLSLPSQRMTNYLKFLQELAVRQVYLAPAHTLHIYRNTAYAPSEYLKHHPRITVLTSGIWHRNGLSVILHSSDQRLVLSTQPRSFQLRK